jgi:uncharacterized coiled-coil protein SlyX
MALLPIGSPADQQETMFEEPTDFPSSEAYEAPDEPSYEAAETAEDFSEDIPEPVSSKTETWLASEHAADPIADPEPPTVLTLDDFAALEERVLRAVSLVRREREARTAAEERAAALEVQLHAQNPAIDQLQQEVDSLRAEREQVRLRVERLLSQLDALEL